ncbi:hypothetical protein [Shewanella donghaensis]|uniref:hypothetical protein n=1 Tax=Shewanella donghaensis TaxID=238836 RepID=UPI0011828141|nr:hypothetical protein [Shewanella donghaensis]
MDWKIVLAVAGWALAIIQFIFSHIEIKNKNEADLLEKTLSYFGKGAQQRAIGISLIEGIWVKQKKNLDIILPVLITQAFFLLTTTENPDSEERNLIRILFLIEKCFPYATNKEAENAEISEALLSASQVVTGVNLSNSTLKLWFAKFNSGDTEMWDAEVENT